METGEDGCGFLPAQRTWDSRKRHRTHRAAAWLLGFPSARNDWALDFAQVPALGNQLSHTTDGTKAEKRGRSAQEKGADLQRDARFGEHWNVILVSRMIGSGLLHRNLIRIDGLISLAVLLVLLKSHPGG